MNDLGGVYLVVSNFVGICTAIKAYGMGHGLVPLSYLYSVLFSSLYHACDWWSDTCFLPYPLLRDLDFSAAQTVVTTNAMMLIHWVSPDLAIARPVGSPFLQSALIVFFAVLNILLVAATDSSFLIQGAVALAAVGTVAIYLISYRLRYGNYPKYRWAPAVPAAVFAGTSVLLFQQQNRMPRYYDLIHSPWHMLGYASGWYLLSVMPRYDPILNVGQSIGAGSHSNEGIYKVVKVG